MASSDKTATFGIKVPVETNANAAASSVDELRKSVAASQDAVKSYGATLRSLRGSSDEVKGAKERLKAAINAERDAISRNALALGKHGVGLTDLAKKNKDAAGAMSNVKNALGAVGGPADNIAGKFGKLGELFKSTGGLAGLAIVGVVGLTAAFIALGAAVVAGAASLAKFILESGDELRAMGLLREAASGSEENARAFGNQIEALAAKVPKSRKELNDLAVSMSKALVDTRVTGVGIIQTFNAVGQVSSAMGDTAGNAIQGIIDRGKLLGRTGLGLNELQGTGLTFQDVADSFANNTKKSVREVSNELFTMRANVNDVAKALQDASEKRFGKLNLAQKLNIGSIAQKFKDNLAGLTSGLVKDGTLTKVLEGFDKLAGLFDQNTVSGAALKQIITDFGHAAAVVFNKALPVVNSFFIGFEIAVLKFEIGCLKLYAKVKETFGLSLPSNLDLTGVAADAATVLFIALATAVGTVAVAAALVAAPFILVGLAFKGLIDLGSDLIEWFKKADWAQIGLDITNGIINGIKRGAAALWDATKGIADTVKKAFTGALDMHSPSRVFAQYGENTTEGFAQGVEGTRSRASAAVASMVSVPKGGGGASGVGGGNAFHITLSFPEAKDGASVKEALTGASFRAQFQKVLEEALANVGGKVVT